MRTRAETDRGSSLLSANHRGSMDKIALWFSLDERIVEHLRLRMFPDRTEAEGLIIRNDDDRSHRIRYDIETDSAWRIRKVVVSNIDGHARPVVLHRTGDGLWRDDSGSSLPTLVGCYDFDLQASPFTNTLAIRRLALDVGEAVEVCAAFVTVPELDVRPFRQRYTRLSPDSGVDRYLYESLESDFRSELPVDADGLLLEYPGYFRRVGSSELRS